MPITDVLQMMGRAGRPQFDHQGVACIFVSIRRLQCIIKLSIDFYYQYSARLLSGRSVFGLENVFYSFLIGT